jgi:5-methylcytosine-specific restriction protein B
MADETWAAQPLRFEDALSLLDANFAFRSPGGAGGARAYRHTPNGSEVRVSSTPEGVLVQVSRTIPGLQQFAPGSEDGEHDGAVHRYLVQTLQDLEKVVQELHGENVASPEQAVSRTSPSMSIPRASPTKLRATNTVLYGPPGTGKTYLAANRAVALCDGSLPSEVDRARVMQRYEELRKEGRISFVTFHQSYGYEEFVEGLRPQTNAEGQVTYSVVPGVFRRACQSAKLHELVEPGLSGKSIRQRTVYKMSLGQSGSAEGRKVFQYGVENGCVLLGWGDDIDFSRCEDAGAINARVQAANPPKSPESHARYVQVFKHDVQVGDLIVVSLGNKRFRGVAEVTGEYEFLEEGPFHQIRAVKWLAIFDAGVPVTEIYDRDFTASALYKLASAGLRYERLEALLSGQRREEGEAKPHVLIIDEINRANVSKVFGELLTLLEPDKREGEVNAITLTLPYSGDEFCVPSNLHVLGTMNTADRSIALLDTALRRRFDFEEVMPDPAVLHGVLVEGVDLERLLRALNERVEAIYDRDHTLGHAYFMNVRTLEDLERVFRRKVLPLLQEYFYENWSNIRRALNDLGDGDFVCRNVRAPIRTEDEEFASDEPAVFYRLNDRPFPVAAYRRIYEGA